MKFLLIVPNNFGAKFAIISSIVLAMLQSCETKRVYTISPRTDKESAVIKSIVVLYQPAGELKSKNLSELLPISQSIRFAAKKHGLKVIEPDFDSLFSVKKARFNTLKNEMTNINKLCISEIDSSNSFTSNFKTPAFLYHSKALISPMFATFSREYNSPFFALVKIEMREKKILNRLPARTLNYEITIADVSSGVVFYNEKKLNKGLLNKQQLNSIFYESFDVLKFGNY